MAARKSSGGTAVASRSKAKAVAVPAVPAPAATPSVAPKAAAACGGTGTKAVTQEMIAKRAYQIWQSGKGGSDWQNWMQAERDLRAGK